MDPQKPVSSRVEKKLHLYTEVNIIYPLLPRIYLLAIDREPITPFTGVN